MELKVWTDDGMLSVVSGVNIKTTCRDVMVAVAQATGGVGRYCMTICFRDVYKRLNPSDKPLLILGDLGGSWFKDARFFVSSSTKALGELKPRLKAVDIILTPHEDINEPSDLGILKTRASGAQDLKNLVSKRNDIPHLLCNQTSVNTGGPSGEEQNLWPCYHPDESNRSCLTLPYSMAIHPSRDHSFEQVNKLHLESLTVERESDPSHMKHHQMQSEDRNPTLLISNKMDSYLKLQDRMISLKNERKKEDEIANFEMQKIDALLRSVAELQTNNDKISMELEELELVSWKDKLQIEKTKEDKLQINIKEAERNLEILNNYDESLDNDIASIKEQIVAEENLKELLMIEIEELKQNISVRSQNTEKLQDAIEKTNTTTLEEISENHKRVQEI